MPKNAFSTKSKYQNNSLWCGRSDAEDISTQTHYWSKLLQINVRWKSSNIWAAWNVTVCYAFALAQDTLTIIARSTDSVAPIDFY